CTARRGRRRGIRPRAPRRRAASPADRGVRSRPPQWSRPRRSQRRAGRISPAARASSRLLPERDEPRLLLARDDLEGDAPTLRDEEPLAPLGRKKPALLGARQAEELGEAGQRLRRLLHQDLERRVLDERLAIGAREDVL